MAASTATDKRTVSLTKRQWHLIVNQWDDRRWQQYFDVMERAVPVILAKCEEVKSLDDIVAVPGSLSGWETIMEFCGDLEVLRWNVLDDIEKQIKVYIHGG